MKFFTLVLFLAFTSFLAKAQNACPANIGFETGDFSNWQCYAGTVALVSGQNVVTVSPSSPLPYRHMIMYGNFYDMNVPTLPVVAPGSSYSARLGFNNTTGSDAERLGYTLTVPTGPNSFSITYQYAVVQQNPQHTPLESQPHFSAKIYDSTTGQYLSCTTNRIFFGSPTGGLLPTSNPNIMYTPWTSVTVVLDDYKGHKLHIEFTNGDCTFGGHWAYSYVDVAAYCGTPTVGNNFCPGTTPTVVGPFGFQSYTWWNSNFTQTVGNTQTLTLPTAPASPTVYAVDMVPFANYGCRDTVFVTVQQMPGVPANAGPDQTMCFGGPGVTIGTPAVSGYSYTWIPATGMPNPSAPQQVVQPGTTTSFVVVAVNGSTGCSSKDTVTVNVINPATPVVSLAGNLLTSSAPTGNQWYLNGNAIAGATGTTYTATANGNYSVKITVSGCTSAMSNSVTYSVTGIDPIMTEWKLQIAPNPATDKLVVTYGGNQKLDLEVLDLTGRQLFTSRNIPASYTVDLSRYLNGSYLVRLVNSKTKQEVKKLVVKM